MSGALGSPPAEAMPNEMDKGTLTSEIHGILMGYWWDPIMKYMKSGKMDELNGDESGISSFCLDLFQYFDQQEWECGNPR